MSVQVHIGLGCNLGDREQQLLRAAEALGQIDAVGVVARSSLYDSAPVGPPQPRYLNAVMELVCDLLPARLLGILQHIERDLGRVSSERWGPRAMDLDLLLWGPDIICEPLLQIPHLGLHQRRFVLEPLCEVSPGLRHPVLGILLEELLRALPPQDVVKLQSDHWPLLHPSGREEPS